MAVVLLSIVTLGIYDLFWLVSVKKELNQKTTVHTPTLWLLFTPLLAFAVVIAAMFMTAGGSNRGSAIAELIINMVAVLAIIPITFYWFFKFSKAVNEYTKGEMSTAMSFILLWLLRFIGLAVIQDKFNDMIAAGSVNTPASSTASVVPASANGAVVSSPEPSVVAPLENSAQPVTVADAAWSAPPQAPVSSSTNNPVAPVEPPTAPVEPPTNPTS